MTTAIVLAALAASTPLALSDGTPVEFVKITSKDRIQVRVPTSHPLASQDDGGTDPTLRIFARDGSHFKNRTDLTLVATSAAEAPASIPTAAAPVSAVSGTYTVGGNDFDDFDDAKQEAIDIFSETGANVDIVQTITKIVGTIGFSVAA